MSIVGLVPLPLLFGFIRMLKNLLLRLICGKVWLKARNEKRRELRLKGVRRRRSWGLGVCALLSIVFAKVIRDGDTSYLCDDVWGPHHWMQGELQEKFAFLIHQHKYNRL